MYFITFKCWKENVMLRKQTTVQSTLVASFFSNSHLMVKCTLCKYYGNKCVSKLFYRWWLNIIIFVVVVSNESPCFIFIDPILNIHIELRSIIVWQKDSYEILHHIHWLFSQKIDIEHVFIFLLFKWFVILI